MSPGAEFVMKDSESRFIIDMAHITSPVPRVSHENPDFRLKVQECHCFEWHRDGEVQGD